MKVERVEIARFRLPLSRPYHVGTVHATERVGRLVRLVSEDGLVGYGEISPLPGLHGETLAEADVVLGTVGPDLTGRTFASFEALAANVADRVAACAPHGEFGAPSVVFGLQCAGLALFAARDGVTPARVLAPRPRERVPINALLVGGVEHLREALASGALAAYDTIKTKVGAGSVAQDRERLRLLLEGLPAHVRLRLDANRQLELDDAVARFEGLPAERIEYIEEPLADPQQLSDLHARTGLRIALDETLHVSSLYYLGRAPWVAAWCLKPARIGHWQRMQFLAREAERHEASLVVSCCLETGLGLWAQIQMAAALPGALRACGLGTESWLRLDLVDPAYDSTRGSVRTADWQGTPSPRVLDKLQFRRAC